MTRCMRTTTMAALFAGLFFASQGRGESVDELLGKANDLVKTGQLDEALALANKAVQADATSGKAFFFRAVLHDRKRQYQQAIADYTKVIELEPDVAYSAHDRRGDANLKAGHMKAAIADFDAFLKVKPQFAAQHWRRGIACYYAGQFDKGVKQFELHKTVNASDVENSVWHFLCKAQLDGLDKARAAMIPLASRDGRVPMMKVYDMFAGRATPDDVLAEARKLGPDSRQGESTLFYAHLYVGLYYEAAQKPDLARKHLVIAATEHTSPYYMGDVARVHVKLLDQVEKKKKGGGKDKPSD